VIVIVVIATVVMRVMGMSSITHTPDSQHLDLPIANDGMDNELFPPEQGEITYTRRGD